MEKCREMGFSNTITLTSADQIQLKFLEDVQLRFLSLFLEFEPSTRFLVNFMVPVSYMYEGSEIFRVEVQKPVFLVPKHNKL